MRKSLVVVALALASVAGAGEQRQKRVKCTIWATPIPGYWGAFVTGSWSGTGKTTGVVSVDAGTSVTLVGNPFVNVALPYTYQMDTHVLALDVAGCHAEFVLPFRMDKQVQQ